MGWLELEFLRRTWLGRGLLALWVGPDAESGDTTVLWAGGDLAYRLVSWPDLRRRDRTASVYRTLSSMGRRAVSVAWFARRTGLAPSDAQELLDWLILQGYAEPVGLPSECPE